MTGLDSLTDNYFDCVETPLWFPTDLRDYKSIGTCQACVVRLTSDVAGPGKLRTTVDGFDLDENPQVELAYNGLQHTLFECRLLLAGAHRLAGDSSVGVAEVQAYFRGLGSNNTSIYCLCIPVQVGEGRGNKYFSTLSLTGAGNRENLDSLFEGIAPSLLEYVGADLRGRHAEDARPRAVCDPVKRIKFLVSLSPAFITAAQLERIQKLKGAEYKGPPTRTKQAVAKSRIESLTTIVPELKFSLSRKVAEAKKAAASGPSGTTSITTDPEGTIPTSALKCHRIDIANDVKGDRIYVNPGKTTLKDELDAASDISRIADLNEKAVIPPGRIEAIVGIAIGILVGVIICAFLAFYTLDYTYPNYTDVLRRIFKFDIPKVGNKITGFFSSNLLNTILTITLVVIMVVLSFVGAISLAK